MAYDYIIWILKSKGGFYIRSEILGLGMIFTFS